MWGCSIEIFDFFHQTRRRGSGVFAGKDGFITLRDLFRWAERYHLASSAEMSKKQKFFDWDQLLADNGDCPISPIRFSFISV